MCRRRAISGREPCPAHRTAPSRSDRRSSTACHYGCVGFSVRKNCPGNSRQSEQTESATCDRGPQRESGEFHFPDAFSAVIPIANSRLHLPSDPENETCCTLSLLGPRLSNTRNMQPSYAITRYKPIFSSLSLTRQGCGASSTGADSDAAKCRNYDKHYGTPAGVRNPCPPGGHSDRIAHDTPRFIIPAPLNGLLKDGYSRVRLAVEGLFPQPASPLLLKQEGSSQ